MTGWANRAGLEIEQTSTLITQHGRILSPLHHLPPEILHEVFLWVCPLTEASGVYLTSSRRYVPWVLAHVCKAWRTSALGLAALWARLPVIRMNSFTDDTSRQSGLLRELLRRSGMVPLDVYFHCKRGLPVSPTYDLLHLLMAHSERWRVVVFRMLFDSDFVSILRGIKGKLPLLESLSLKIYPGDSNAPGQVDTFAVAPRLRSVFVLGTYAPRLKLPLTQLINFSEKRIGKRSFLPTILSPTAPSSVLSLQHLTLLEMNTTSPLQGVILPHLTKLRVQIGLWDDEPSFPALTLPALRDLEYASSGQTLTANILPILSAPTYPPGAASPLRRLTYRLKRGTRTHAEGELIDMLRVTPNLVYLDGMLPPCADLLQLADMDEEGTPRIVPHLETCKLFVPPEREFGKEEASALGVLASARCEPMASGGGREYASATVPADPPPDEHTPKLTTLLIYYFNIPSPHLRFGTVLNAHDPASAPGKPLFDALKELHRNLISEEPERHTVIENPLRTLDLTWMDRVSRLLDELEGIEVDAAGIGHVYHSQIHLALRRIEGWDLQQTYGFPERCRAMLDRWDAFFASQLIRELRWIFKGPHCIVYLTKDNPIRDSLDVVYGVPAIPLRDIFWPIFMSHDRYSELDDPY